MNKSEFEFHFDGPQADADADALADFLAEEFPDWPARVGSSRPPPQRPGTRDASTTIAIIALAFSATGALKNVLDLAERIKLQQKFERLIAWAKERRANHLGNPFIALPPRGVSVPLDKVKAEQLLAVLDASTPTPPQKP